MSKKNNPNSTLPDMGIDVNTSHSAMTLATTRLMRQKLKKILLNRLHSSVERLSLHFLPQTVLNVNAIHNHRVIGCACDDTC